MTTDPADDAAPEPARAPRQWIAMIGALVIGVGLQALDPPAGLGREGWIVVSLLIVMGVWWVTEAVPIPVTSLLPIVVLPLAGVMSVREAAAPYAHPVVMLLLGGFIIAKAVERWNLHKRVALNIVAVAGGNPGLMVAGFMLAAALLSMWISNTATTLMMTPIALSVAAAVLAETDNPRLNQPFTFCLLLGLAYAASIGGLATPVGTPTNLIVMGYIEEETGRQIGFAQWMTLGLPVALVMIPAAWFVLVKWVYPPKVRVGAAGHAHIVSEIKALGPITVPEARVLMVFLVIAGLWVFRQPLQGLSIGGISPFAGLTDHVTAILGVVLMFMVPSGAGGRDRGGAILDWESAVQVPWGVYLLFGGGLSLAGAITASGLAVWLGDAMAGLVDLPPIVVVLVLVAFVIFATELTSNIATASALMPVAGAIAVGGGVDPILLAAPIAMAASCAFMLPMATGPNAVVFASGQITIGRMMNAGIRLNLIGIVLITLLVSQLAPLIFGDVTQGS